MSADELELPPPPFTAPRCDFCLRPNPRWSYDVTDFTAASEVINPEATLPLLYFPCASGWAACSRCATIIDRGDVATLAKVATACGARMLLRDGRLPPGVAETLHEHDAAFEADLLAKYRELLPTLKPRRPATLAEKTATPGVRRAEPLDVPRNPEVN